MTLAGQAGPARLSLPRPPWFAYICKSLRPLSTAHAGAGGGGSDLAYLWAQPHAIEDFGVVELMASCEPGFGHLTYLRICVFLLSSKCSQEASQQVSGKEQEAISLSSMGLRSSASESSGPSLKGPIPGTHPQRLRCSSYEMCPRTLLNKFHR